MYASITKQQINVGTSVYRLSELCLLTRNFRTRNVLCRHICKNQNCWQRKRFVLEMTQLQYNLSKYLAFYSNNPTVKGKDLWLVKIHMP